MHTYWRLLLAAVVLLIAGAAWGQDQRPGWLGADVAEVTKEEADKLGWEAPRGAKVVRPRAGSPASEAGLQPDDVIAAIDGVDVENPQGLVSALASKNAGTVVRLRLMRSGRERTVTVTLAARPASLAGADRSGPLLMLDTGGHMSYVGNVAFTPDGKHLVTSSIDMTVRVWDVEAGKSVRVIRGDAVPGAWGEIHGMALSPDGRWLATGGRFHNTDPDRGGAIRLYDFATGQLETLLKGHGDVVVALAFSPDGKKLISGSSDKTAIVWDMVRRRQLLRLSGHTKRVGAVAFTSDGRRLVTGSEDETLRLWRAADGKLIAEMMEHKLTVQREAKESSAGSKGKPIVWDASVLSVAASPTKPVIASASADGRIMLWDSRSGAFLRQLAFPGGGLGGNNADSLSFSPDGRWLLVDTFFACNILDVATGNRLYDGELSTAWKLAGPGYAQCPGGSAYSRDGRLAAGVDSDVVHLIDPRTSRAIKSSRGSGKTVRGVGFAADSRAIAWGDTDDGRPQKMEDGEYKDKLTHWLRLPSDGQPLGVIAQFGAGPSTGSQPEGRGDHYIRGSRQLGSRRVRFKRFNPDDESAIYTNALEILSDSALQEISLGRDATQGALILSADGDTVLVGVTPEIRAYDVKGRFIGSFRGHFGQVRDLASSPDGRFLVSGGRDQTVRLWNAKTRELIVTLFHGSDGEWVMWTPQGYYTGSPGADKIVGWQINKGPEQTPDYVGADQLRQHLHRPDIVERAIILASAEEAVRQAPGTSFKLADLLARPVPRFKIVAPDAGVPRRSGRASVKVAIEATPDPARLIRVQVNGRQVGEQTPELGSGGFAAGERVIDVPLGKGRNELRIALTNAVGEKVETLVLTHNGDGDLDKRGTLHILAIGVDEYKGLGNSCGGAACDLRYSVADARKMAEAIEQRLGPNHARVVKRLLVNGGDAGDAPTAANIIDAVELLRHANETDTVVLFIAGHGVNEGPDYRFLATNAERIQAADAGSSLRGSTVVPWQVLQSAVEAAKGRRILFVDTCHSGNAYNQRLGNAAYHANIIAYTAARFDQEAMEDPGLGHGLFTYAVVEGLDGKSDVGAKRRISTRELAGYVVRRVGELAKALKGEQEPQYFKGRDADDYVLAQW